MTKRQRYFLEQKLRGLGMIVGSVLITLIFRGESAVLPALFVPTGLVFMLTKNMYWQDKYYYEVEENGELD